MTEASTMNALLHVRPILDAAVERGFVEYELSSIGKARRWRLEAYKYRKIMQESGIIDYDRLVISLDGNKVKISLREIGVLRDEKGVVITPEKTLREAEPIDPLLEEALAVARKLDGDDE